MGSKSRASGGGGRGGGISWRTIAFLLLAAAIFTTFVAKHQMHQDLHMNFLEVGGRRGRDVFFFAFCVPAREVEGEGE